MPRVRVHADFRSDQAAQLRWLVEHGEIAWIESLTDGTTWVVRTIERFPGVGHPLAARRRLVLRALRYPKGPYVAWYFHDADDPDGDVTLVRMLHLSQERPEPDFRAWELSE